MEGLGILYALIISRTIGFHNYGNWTHCMWKGHNFDLVYVDEFEGCERCCGCYRVYNTYTRKWLPVSIPTNEDSLIPNPMGIKPAKFYWKWDETKEIQNLKWYDGGYMNWKKLCDARNEYLDSKKKK